MEAVKAFNDELSALYETKPPISKAKMTSITRTAIKAIKFYKHVVQSVEKFIQKCKPEYKVPGLYVIDSIVRQSRHQFGTEKDVFAPRFARNLTQTFSHLFSCPPEDKSKVIRVLNLWQKNGVFDADTINPLFDLADPSHPIHAEQASAAAAAAANSTKTPSSTTKPDTTTPSWISGNDSTPAANSSVLNMLPSSLGDSSMLQQLQQLHNILLNQTSQQSTDGHQHSSTPVKRDRESGDQVKFDKKLLDFDYGDDEDDDGKTSPQQAPAAQPNTQTAAALDSLGSILGNPEVLRQLHNLQLHLNQQQVRQQQTDMEEKLRKLQQMKQQEEEFDKHLAQTLPSLPFANECDFKLNIATGDSGSTQQAMLAALGAGAAGASLSNLKNLDLSQPPPGYPHLHALGASNKSPLEDGERPNSDNDERQHGIRNWVSEAMLRSQNLNRQGATGGGDRAGGDSGAAVVVIDSESPSDSPGGRKRQRGSRYSRSSSRSRSRRRSRSRSRRRRSRSFDRDYDRDDRDKGRSKDSVRDRQRKRKGLPPLRKNHLSVCSTTLWVGHLSRLVQQDELSNTFGEYGDIVSIDLIPPRGCAFICMNRRQDANRALQHLKHHKMQQKAITLAWAPGKGMKGKEWKDYWEVEQGVSYIPWNKLTPQTDFDLLEEGGMFDEESVPEWLKLKLESSKQQKTNEPKLEDPRRPTSSIDTHSQDDTIMNEDDSSKDQTTDMEVTVASVSAPPPGLPPGFIPLPEGPQPPDAHLKGALPPPPLALPPVGIMPPFGLPNMSRLMGPMGMAMGPGLMPNVPLGVPPPGLLSSPLIHQQMMQRLPQPVNSPFNPPPGVGLMSGPPPPLSQIPLPGADKGGGGPKISLPPPVSSASELAAAFTDPLLQMPFSLPPQLQLAPQNALAGPNLRQQSPQQVKVMPPKQDASQSDKDTKDDNQMPSFNHPPPNFPNLNIPPPTSSASTSTTTQNKEGERMQTDDKEDRDSRDKGGKKEVRDRERDRERDYRGGRGRERDYRDRERDYRGRDRDYNRSRDRDRRDRDRRSRDKDDDDDSKKEGGRKSEDRGKDRERDRDRDRDRGDRSRDRDRERDKDRDRRSSRGGGRWSDRDSKRKDDRSMSEEKSGWSSSQENQQNQQDRNDNFNNNNNSVNNNNNNHDSAPRHMGDMHQIPHPEGPPKGGGGPPPHGPPSGPPHGPPSGPPPPRGMGPPPGPMGMMMGDGPRPPFGPGGPPPMMFGPRGPPGGPPGQGGPPGGDMFQERPPGGGGGGPPPGMDPDAFDIMGMPPHMHHGEEGPGFGGPPPRGPVDMFADGPGGPMDGPGPGGFGGPGPMDGPGGFGGPGPMDGPGGFGGPGPMDGPGGFGGPGPMDGPGGFGGPRFGGGPPGGQDRIRIEFFPRGRGMRPEFGPRMMGRGGPMGPMFSPRGPGPRSPMRGPRPGVWMENQGPPGPPGGPGFPPRGFMTPPGGGPVGGVPPLVGPGGEGPPQPLDDGFSPQRNMNVMRGPMRGRFPTRGGDRRSSRWSMSSPNGAAEEDDRKEEEKKVGEGGQEDGKKEDEKKSCKETPMETDQPKIETVEKSSTMEVDVPKMEENVSQQKFETKGDVKSFEPSACESEKVIEDKGLVKGEENISRSHEERREDMFERNEESSNVNASRQEWNASSNSVEQSFEKEPVSERVEQSYEKEPVPEHRVSVEQHQESTAVSVEQSYEKESIPVSVEHQAKEFVAREEPTEPHELSKQETSIPEITSRTFDIVEPSLNNSSNVEPVECSTAAESVPE